MLRNREALQGLNPTKADYFPLELHTHIKKMHMNSINGATKTGLLKTLSRTAHLYPASYLSVMNYQGSLPEKQTNKQTSKQTKPTKNKTPEHSVL